MDVVQILLIIILSLSTLFLAVIGVQLFLTLRELQKTIRHANKIVEGFESVGSGLQQGLTEITGFMNGFKVILRAIHLLNQTKHESAKK
jgi:hypothetical protein